MSLKHNFNELSEYKAKLDEADAVDQGPMRSKIDARYEALKGEIAENEIFLAKELPIQKKNASWFRNEICLRELSND